jgi:hypothetical protein
MADGQQGGNTTSNPNEGERRGESPNFAPDPPACPIPNVKCRDEDARKYDELEDGYAITVGDGMHCVKQEEGQRLKTNLSCAVWKVSKKPFMCLDVNLLHPTAARPHGWYSPRKRI